jgi:hypothetical protein
MTQTPDYDPIRKSWREAGSFNLAWLKNGEKMTWMQRIGFATMSFIVFSSGLLVETLAINSLLNGEFLSLGTVAVVGGIAVGLFVLVLGVLGLRNVLRF